VLLFLHDPTQTSFSKLVTCCTCSERLFYGFQIYMRHEFLAAIDIKIQSIFVTNINGKFLVMDLDILMFFLKERENKSSLFLLPCLLLYSHKLNFGTWSRNIDYTKRYQKSGL
jgi:hypothetical protein